MHSRWYFDFNTMSVNRKQTQILNIYNRIQQSPVNEVGVRFITSFAMLLKTPQATAHTQKKHCNYRILVGTSLLALGHLNLLH